MIKFFYFALKITINSIKLCINTSFIADKKYFLKNIDLKKNFSPHFLSREGEEIILKKKVGYFILLVQNAG